MSTGALGREQGAWLDAALARLDTGRLAEFNRAITAIASPTGRERPLADFIAAHLRGFGIAAEVQALEAGSANVIARLPGSGGGPSLMLYSAMDTHLEGGADDLPWAGKALREDMRTEAVLRDGFVYGLGAANPKAMVSGIVEALVCAARTGRHLTGDVVLALASGGMPVNRATGDGPPRGLADGGYHLLTRGMCADYALVLKPGTGVYHEEPGLCWFRIVVRGRLGYAGIPRSRPGFRGAIVPAARVVLALEEWLRAFPERHARGQVAPEGAITSVRSGWPDKPAFSPAAAVIGVDLRCAPHQTPAAVKAEFSRFVEQLRADDPELEIEWEMCGAFPGSRTDPDNRIIGSAIRGWEFAEGTPYREPAPHSGQTDVSLLRNLGIPTARIGLNMDLAGVAPEFREGLGGMGVSRIEDVARACRKLLYCIADICGRDAAQASSG